jgi:hypothetical protein
MNSIKCLCASCGSKCSLYDKTKMAVNGRLIYLYLKNGEKLTYSCKSYRISSRKIASDIFLGREGMLKII